MNRQKSIKVRLTESEYELLKKQANGQPMASYMRSVCLGNSQTPSKNTPNIHPQLLRQLAGIGNNTSKLQDKSITALLQVVNLIAPM